MGAAKQERAESVTFAVSRASLSGCSSTVVRAVKTRNEVTAEKLRGGFYTPRDLVDFCIERVSALAPAGVQLRVLEPSIGDGAFVAGLDESVLASSIDSVLGLEVDPREATKATTALERSRLSGRILEASAVSWAADTSETFDIAMGNPPFVRFQFLRDRDKAALIPLGKRLGLPFGGVGNLWIPVLLGALSRLRPGGAAAFVIPTECLTGVSAGSVRRWLIEHIDDLKLDLFPPGSFPGVLQEILVLSGRRRDSAASQGTLEMVEHSMSGDRASWRYLIQAGPDSWSRYLLEPGQLEALDSACAIPIVRSLGEAAALEVSIVTGANDYFSAETATVSEFELGPWAQPLLPRLRHAAGLIYKNADQRATALSGARAWLLDFSAERPDPREFARPRAYLDLGQERELHLRYKCRIREPWYRVPSVRAGELLLSKRSHRFHRLVLNTAATLTTDTIYRGWMRPGFRDKDRDLVAGFHNSLTLLSAELEGRSFGGGVLELVPSEIARLKVPLIDAFGSHLASLDALLRASGSEESVVEATDALLISSNLGFSPELMLMLREARHSLLARRLGRNSHSSRDVETIAA
jgi:adenine-specific DNA-methyltransferase